MKITFWHAFAHYYLTKQLELAEIVKWMMIAVYTGVIEDDEGKQIGVNVLDNRQLHQAIVLGMISAYGEERSVSYSQLSEYVPVSMYAVRDYVKALEKDGKVTRLDRYQTMHGVRYEAKTDHLPAWMMEFTSAIVEVEENPEFKQAVWKRFKNRNFIKGWEVLKAEVWKKVNLPGFKERASLIHQTQKANTTD